MGHAYHSWGALSLRGTWTLSLRGTWTLSLRGRETHEGPDPHGPACAGPEHDDFRVAGLHASYVAQAEGFEVVGTAHTAADALRLAAEVHPDLVLLDEYLPDANGSSIIGLFDGAVLVVSAAEDSAVVRRAISAGAVNYVLKPFPPAVLVDRLHASAGSGTSSARAPTSTRLRWTGHCRHCEPRTHLWRPRARAGPL